MEIEALLRELELHRLRDPKDGISAARDALQIVPSEYIPLVLGEWASCLRRLGQLSEALAFLDKAETFASTSSVKGDLLRRRAFIYASQGQINIGLEYANASLCAYVDACDANGIGKAQVARGGLFFLLEEFKQSAIASNSSLRFLARHEENQRFSAHVNLANAQLSLQHTQQALQGLETALSDTSAVAETLLRKAEWLLAEAAIATNRPEKAVSPLQKAVDHFLATSQLVDAALATALLVKALLLSGKTSEATKRAKLSAKLLRPLAKNPLASEAITDLVRFSLISRKKSSKADVLVLQNIVSSLRRAAK